VGVREEGGHEKGGRVALSGGRGLLRKDEEAPASLQKPERWAGVRRALPNRDPIPILYHARTSCAESWAINAMARARWPLRNMTTQQGPHPAPKTDI
jgi:hypothetical protein